MDKIDEFGPIRGPWFWRQAGNFCAVESETGADHGGNIGVCLLEHTRPEQLRRLRATASLIAAAPDLLRSLDEIVKFIEFGGDASSMRRTHNAMLKSGGPDTSMIGKAKAALKRTRFWEDEP